MKVIGCIPARYGSTRFEGKVLAKDTGKYLIQHTWEQATKAQLPEEVIIAADDERILRACEQFGARCVMTRPDHASGTDRIAEATAGIEADIVVNIQGDEPEIEPAHIDKVAGLLADDAQVVMSTLAAGFNSAEEVADPNVVKVVMDGRGRAMYFSRLPIPFDREAGGVGEVGNYRRHVGIYAYRKWFLQKLAGMEQTRLEKLEKLEQLRVLENGYDIVVGQVEHPAVGIDTEQQYAEFVKRFQSRKERENG